MQGCVCVREGKGQSCGEHLDTIVLLNSAKTDAVPWDHSGYSKAQDRLSPSSFSPERRLRTPGYSGVSEVGKG